jgi:hypothetical protein
MVQDNFDRIDDEEKYEQKFNHILLNKCFQDVVESVWYVIFSEISLLQYIVLIVMIILPSPILILIFF